MTYTNNGHRGSSIVTRRTSSASNNANHIVQRQGPSGAVVIVEDSDKLNSYAGLWIYPEIMDIIALVAALCLGVSTAAMFSFSYEEILPANQRYIDYHVENGIWAFWVNADQENPVFLGMMIFTSLSTLFSSLALVFTVGTRIILTYIINMKKSSRKRRFLLQWANPLSVFALLVWISSIILSAPAIYFTAWVVFPPEVANNSFIFVMGCTFMVATIVFFFLSILLAMRAKSIEKEEIAETEKALAGTTATEHAGNGDSPMKDFSRRDEMSVNLEPEEMTESSPLPVVGNHPAQRSENGPHASIEM